MSLSHKGLAIAALLALAGAGSYPAYKWYTKHEARHDLAALGITYSEQQFIDSACDGNSGAIMLFLDAGMNINVAAISSRRGGIPRTALQCALMTMHIETAQYLVNRGADVTLADSEGNTPLYYLARYAVYTHASEGQRALAEQFLAHGANVNAAGKGGTPLAAALLANANDLMELLLDHGADINITSNDGTTPLMAFARNRGAFGPNHLDEMKKLLDKGADINAVNQSGNTALSYAMQNRDKAMVNLLLAKGANPNVPDGIAGQLLQSALADPDLVQTLLKYGVDVNTPFRNTNLLHYFIERNNDTAVQMLLTHKEININVTDEHGDTPLHIAAQRNNAPLISRLISLGADVNVQNLNSQTPLFKAVFSQSEAAVNELIRDGADVNFVDRDGHTALYYASSRGDRNSVYQRYGRFFENDMNPRSYNEAIARTLRNSGAKQ